ncbi:hypothetical protein [Bacillus sp. FJAT-18017]|uniref:hypothetical protein n=1 Tax=Bacillus sp. FJAT-18017 TaxID=1705566 RepID=UPI0006AD99C2|nr:hypothetical protein [Bacillus sp. FJAT-18017]
MQMNPYQAQGGYQQDQMMQLCRNYMNYHVVGQMADGSQVEGILDDMDQEGVTMLVPEDVDAGQQARQFGGFYNNYGDDYDGGRRRRYRRYRRRRFPYPYITVLYPYPYFYPPYQPYPYGYGYGY